MLSICVYISQWRDIYLKAFWVLSSLQQHLQTTNLQFYSSLYSECFYWGVCWSIILQFFYRTLSICVYYDTYIFRLFEFYLHFSSTYRHQNLQFFTLYIMNVFTVGFVDIYFSWFIIACYLFVYISQLWDIYLKAFWVFPPLQQYLHKPKLTVYSYLYSECFYWRVCGYIIDNSFVSKTWWKCIRFVFWQYFILLTVFILFNYSV